MRVQVKYKFIFEPDNTFRKKSDIDSFIAQAFLQVGYQSELVQTGKSDEVESTVFLSLKETDITEEKPEKTPRSQKFLASRKVK